MNRLVAELTMDGHDGNDEATFEEWDGALELTAEAGSITIDLSDSSETAELLDIEKIVGTDQNDVFTLHGLDAYSVGNALAELHFGKGNDTVRLEGELTSITVAAINGGFSDQLDITNLEVLTLQTGSGHVTEAHDLERIEVARNGFVLLDAREVEQKLDLGFDGGINSLILVGDINDDADITLFLSGIELRGGELEDEDGGDSCRDDSNSSDDENVYEGEYGETYEFNEDTGALFVTYEGAILSIGDWSKDDLGIRLEDGEDADGTKDDCDEEDDFASPLVLDLDGDGIELTDVGGGVHFDIDRDGVRERTGWVAADDGLLTLDRNGNGAVDGAGELFGYGETFSSAGGRAPLSGRLQAEDGTDIRYASGFDQLAELDEDSDGRITAANAGFADLRVWRDLDQDGVSGDGELFTLGELGIAYVSVEATRVSETNEGNFVSDTAAFGRTDGTTGEVADVWFRFDQTDRTFERPDGYDEALDALPDLTGSGRAMTLRYAMAQDARLRAMVEEFANLGVDDAWQLSGQVRDIVTRWTGASGQDRGAYADGEVVETLEALEDRPFAQWSGSNPRPNAGASLTERYDNLVRNLAVELVAQTDLGRQLFPEITFEASEFKVLADGTVSTTMIDRVVDNAPSEALQQLSYFQATFRVLDTIFLSFEDVGGTEAGRAAYRASVEAVLNDQGIDLSYAELIGMQVHGDRGGDHVTISPTGGEGNSIITQVTATGTSNDDIALGGNKQIFYFGEGAGNDTVSIAPFNYLGWSFEPRVELRLVGLSADDVEFARAEGAFSTDLSITIRATGETLTVRDFFDPSVELSGAVALADGTRASFNAVRDELSAAFGTGGDGNDYLIQFGNAVLEGGAGNDTLEGDDRATTYRVSPGDGRDTIRDVREGADNTLEFAGGIVSADVIFDRSADGRDLIVTYGQGDVITIKDQYNSFGDGLGNGYVIDLFVFEDEIRDVFQVVESGLNAIVGTSLADILDGTEEDDYVTSLDGDDIVRVGAGDDVVEGGNGADTIEGGAGNDRVFGQRGEDLLSGGSGADTLVAGSDSTTLQGGDGDDILVRHASTRGTNHSDLFVGGAGNDVIFDIGGRGGADTMVGGLGNDLFLDGRGQDTFRYDAGDGLDIVAADNDEYGWPSYDYHRDVLELDEGILAEDLSFSIVLLTDEEEAWADAGALSVFEWAGLDRWQLSSATGGFDQSGLFVQVGEGREGVILMDPQRDYIGARFSIELADGTTFRSEDVIAELLTPSDADQTIIAPLGYEADTISGGGGNDTLVGSRGATTFVYERVDGDDTIVNGVLDFGRSNYYANDTIAFGEGIAAGDLAFSRGSDGAQNLVIEIAGGGSILVVDQFDLREGVSNAFAVIPDSFIQTLSFADGTTLDVTTIAADLGAGTEGNDHQFGLLGAYTFASTAGNDTLEGSFGSDEYAFGRGSGNDVVRDDDKADEQVDPVEEYDDGYGEYDLSLSTDHWEETDVVRFGEGITLSDLTLTAQGSDLLIGIADTDDTFLLEGQLAATGSWGTMSQAAADRIFVGTAEDHSNYQNVSINDVLLDRPVIGSDDLAGWVDYYDVPTTGSDQGGGLVDLTPFFAGVERFVFADGTEYSRSEFASLLTTDTTGSNTLETGVTGGTLDGGLSDDTLLGGMGDDTFVLGIGYGDDLASDQGGDDAVAFGAGIEATSIAFTRTGEGGDDLLIEVGGTERTAMVIEGQFADDGRQIETFELDDGSVWTAQDIERDLLRQSVSDASDTILGYEGNDVISGRGGDDRIESRGGDDLIDGGIGRDTAVFRRAADDYEIVTEDGYTTVTDLTGLDGTATLVNVEDILFLGDQATDTEQVVSLADNTRPTAGNLAIEMSEDGTLSLLVSDLIALGSDPDGDTLTARITGAQGGAVMSDGRTIEFFAERNLTGSAAIDFVVVDASGAEAAGQVEIMVLAVNDAPVAIGEGGLLSR